jgi:hypothetical protein
MFGGNVKSLKESCIDKKILNEDKTLIDKKMTPKDGVLTEAQKLANSYYDVKNRKERRKLLKVYKKLKSKQLNS